jgi:hypothetical protein
LSVDFELSTLKNYPGGIRGRVNPATGTDYAVWLYPGNGKIVLWWEVAWNIDTTGLTQLGAATGIAFDNTAFNTVKLAFRGSSIQVYYNGTLIISATGSTYGSGLIALDVSNQKSGSTM